MAGPSRSLVEVGISMVLQDGFTSQAGKISSSYSSLMNNMNQWNRAVSQSAGAAFDYGTRLVGGMYEAYKHSAKVSLSVNEVNFDTEDANMNKANLSFSVNLSANCLHSFFIFAKSDDEILPESSKTNAISNFEVNSSAAEGASMTN